jgi:hypothetical protein
MSVRLALKRSISGPNEDEDEAQRQNEVTQEKDAGHDTEQEDDAASEDECDDTANGSNKRRKREMKSATKGGGLGCGRGSSKRHPTIDSWLPEGWEIERKTRKSGEGAKETSRVDKIFISPDGVRFRSSVAAKKSIGLGAKVAKVESGDDKARSGDDDDSDVDTDGPKDELSNKPKPKKEKKQRQQLHTKTASDASPKASPKASGNGKAAPPQAKQPKKKEKRAAAKQPKGVSEGSKSGKSGKGKSKSYKQRLAEIAALPDGDETRAVALHKLASTNRIAIVGGARYGSDDPQRLLVLEYHPSKGTSTAHFFVYNRCVAAA